MAWCTSVTYSLSSPPVQQRSSGPENGHLCAPGTKAPRSTRVLKRHATTSRSSRLLHHRIGVFPDTRVDETIERHRLLVRLDGADLLHQAGGGFELTARKTVILDRPKLNVEEVLQRLFVHFLAVPGVGRDFCDSISVFRVL